MEADVVRAGLRMYVPKCHTLRAQQGRQLGFDVDFADGKFRVSVDRWEALHEPIKGLVGAKHDRGFPRGRFEGDI